MMGRVTDAHEKQKSPSARSRMTGKQRREQLIDVGRKLFADKGFEATTVEEISSKAGVSKPVVYEHFGGKEGLYAVVVDREIASLLDGITGALSADLGSRETLERVVRQPHLRCRKPGRAHPRGGVQAPEARPEDCSPLRADARRDGGPHRTVVAGLAQDEEGRRRRTPGQPRVERPGQPREQAAAHRVVVAGRWATQKMRRNGKTTPTGVRGYAARSRAS